MSPWVIRYGPHTLRYEDLTVGLLATVRDIAGIDLGPQEWALLTNPEQSVQTLASYVSALVAKEQDVPVEQAAMLVAAMHPLELMACFHRDVSNEQE